MDDEAVTSITTRKSWPVLLRLSAFLEAAERDAVLGDLAEDGDSSGRAIADLLGLVVRRRMAILSDLRLWVALALFILPVGFLLSMIAHSTAGIGAVYSWMYFNNWDWALTRNPGFWYVLREIAPQFAITCLLLACWSWSAGFLIGRLPNEILRAGRNAFILLLAASQLGNGPHFLIRLWMYFHGLQLRSYLPDPNAPVTANIFYQMFFPWIILATLVILPAISGIRQGKLSLRLRRKMRIVLVTAVVASLLTFLIHPDFGFLLGTPLREWLWRNGTATQTLWWLSCWPLPYMIAVSFRRSRQASSVKAH